MFPNMSCYLEKCFRILIKMRELNHERMIKTTEETQFLLAEVNKDLVRQKIESWDTTLLSYLQYQQDCDSANTDN